MKKIARIGNYPTNIHNKVGFHAYQLGTLSEFETFYISANIKGEPLEPLGNSKLKVINFFMDTFPKGGSNFSKLVFTLKRVFSILIFSLKSVFYLTPKKVNIVHIHSPMYSLIALWGNLLGKKVYITFHGEDFNRIKDSKIYKFSSFLYHGVFAISPTMIDRLKEIHKGADVALVGNGIEKEFRNLRRKRKKQIIFVGSFKPVKGHKMMVDGFELFQKEKQYYKLIFVGEGLLFAEIKEYVASKGLSDQVDFLGQKNMNELVELYNDSELFALNSFSEGFPKVILEALVCGCKIVSTKVGSVPEIMGKDYPYFIEDHTPEGIKSALLKATKADDVSFSQYEDIPKKHTWEGVRKVYVEQYEREK